MRNQLITSGLLLVLALRCADAQEGLAVVAKPLTEVTQATLARAPAQVLASNQSVIAAEVNSVISIVKFDVGDRVEKGDILVELDPRDFQLQLAQSNANLAAQEARIRRGEIRLKRARELAQENFLSDDELLERQTDLDVLQADRRVVEVSVAAAKRELEKTRVKAPFDGVVLTRESQVGAFVSLGMPLLTLAETGNPRVMAQISSGDVPSVKNGRKLLFKNEDGEWPVKLVEVADILNDRTLVQNARFSFTEEQPVIGSSGYLVWTRSENVVATDIVIRRSNQLGVFTIMENKAVFHPLPKAEEGRPAVINLPENTLIIIEGQQRIQDGDTVTNEA